MGDPIRAEVVQREAQAARGLERVCVFCLMPKARVKIDKNGSPFLVCASCGSRAFMKGAESFRGVSLLQELVVQVVGDDPRRLWALQAELDGERSVAHQLWDLAKLMNTWASKPATAGLLAERPEPTPVQAPAAPAA